MTTTTTPSIIAGANPLDQPICLLILQILIIMLVTRLLGVILAKIRQPRVIAEVVGGILLGPSAMGRIPGFTETIFPPESLGTLSLVAELGLVLFLFLVGLELDLGSLARQLRGSVSISLTGIVLPFALGIAVSVGLYNYLMDDPLPSFAAFLLFTGVAMSITAFPVLARILTEMNLLSTPVGITTIGAAAVDDAIAWCLLALVMAIINNQGSPIIALYVFLVLVGYVLFCLFIVRPQLARLIKLSSYNDTVSQYMVFLIFVMVLVSAFFTAALGVHSIFGAFLIGVITPHESGFAIRLVEKIEDLVSVLLLPLYFAASGLRTDVTQMNSGLDWAFFFAVFFTACGGKIIGCTLASRASKHSWRDSFTIGVLMNCKGLVELIVLNLGLSAHVINVRIFTLMVLVALATTFMTVPLVSWIIKTPAGKGALVKRAGCGLSALPGVDDGDRKLSVLVALHSMRTVPACMTLVQLLQTEDIYKLDVHALRLIELSERTSTVMKATQSAETIRHDPIINIMRTFGRLTRVGVEGHLAVTHSHDFCSSIVSHAIEVEANLIIVPWVPPTSDAKVETSDHETKSGSGPSITPVQTLALRFAAGQSTAGEAEENSSNGELNQFTAASVSSSVLQGAITHAERARAAVLVEDVLKEAPCSVGVLLERGFGVTSDAMAGTTQEQHIIMPFVGGADDREALCLLMFLAHKSGIRATVICMRPLAERVDEVGSPKSPKGDIEGSINCDSSAGKEVPRPQRTPSAETIVPAADDSENEPEALSSSSGLAARPSAEGAHSTRGRRDGSVIDFEADDDDILLRRFGKMCGENLQMEEMFTDDPTGALMERLEDSLGRKDLVLVGYSLYSTAVSRSVPAAPLATQSLDMVQVTAPEAALLDNSAANVSSATMPTMPPPRATVTFANLPEVALNAEGSAHEKSLKAYLDGVCVSSVLVVSKHSQRSLH